MNQTTRPTYSSRKNKVGRIINYVQAINEATMVAMDSDPHMICFGLGIDDPKRIFGTTAQLREKYGANRVFDTPTSEAAMTGIGIGASLGGLRCLTTHQRLDFFLLAMDQLVNNAAKWQYMFGGQSSPVRMVIRLILGRGWGQGPTHSQNLQAWFAHIPGLKVVMPSTPEDAKGLLLSSLFDNNPVLFLEHRWLHNAQGEVEPGDFRIPLGKAKKVPEGKDLSIVSMSYMTIEAIKAASELEKLGIDTEIIDLRTISPIDWQLIFDSVRKTGRLMVLDTSHGFCSVSSEIVSKVARHCFDALKKAPIQICLPDFPCPTAPSLTKNYYPTHQEIIEQSMDILGKTKMNKQFVAEKVGPHDVPGFWFKGPF